MNKFNLILAASALAVAGFAATSSANAAVICSGCEFAGNATYLGSHNPGTGDLSTFQNSDLAAGFFEDVWLFEIDPAGQVAINALFLPTNAVADFAVSLYTATPTCTLGAAGSLCDSGTFGTLLATGPTALNYVLNIPFLTASAGFYAFVIEGTVSDILSTRSYSGQLTTKVSPVPEPTTLALLGLGLVGIGVARRRRV